MSMTWDITCEKDLLVVRPTGDYSLSESEDCIVDTFEALAEHKVQKVLVDCRQLKGEPTTLERFAQSTFGVQEMEKFAASGGYRGTRFAFVGEEPLIDRHRFGETVATNRGLNVKVSIIMKNALRWLETDRPDKAIDGDKK